MLDILVAVGLCLFSLYHWLLKKGTLSSFWSWLDWDGGVTNELPYPKRIPSSIGILYTKESAVNMDDLSRFVIHCENAGIRKIVVYGGNDVEKMGVELLKCVDHNGMESKTKIRLINGDTEKMRKDDMSDVTRINIISYKRGRQCMVEVAKKLCSSSETIRPSHISSLLEETMLNDIDVVLSIGGVPSLVGFPPWPLRITEFVPLDTVPRSRKSFIDCLEVYSARDIRQGR